MRRRRKRTLCRGKARILHFGLANPSVCRLWNSKGKVTMRSLFYVTFLAILSINVHSSACLRLLAETPLPVIPNGQPGAPAPPPPANIPVNLPANVPPEMPANLPANVPPEMLASLPANLPANVATGDGGQLAGQRATGNAVQDSANVSPEVLAHLPPDVLAQLPANVSSSRPNVPPEKLVAEVAAAGKNQPAVAAAAGIPQMPKMPDFSGLTDLSFPPMPSAKMPSMPHNITLFGFDVQIPEFINKMVDEETT
ncbi:hypothetical protein OsJ_23050 [Oryza sativa Japonica Group]|uniref:Uncharacterized protein n=1 Tax=Oryza sativa subsp. japonica TaxID=39947 RepID=B9FVF9_ORYSJ|nr:hypothetical protein OsJ_23050 [Oryza sativa Japonica Group]